MGSEKPTHEVVKTSLQTEEEVGECRLGNTSNRAVGKNQVESDDVVENEAVLISLVGVPYCLSVSAQSGREPPGTNLRRVTSRRHRPGT